MEQTTMTQNIFLSYLKEYLSISTSFYFNFFPLIGENKITFIEVKHPIFMKECKGKDLPLNRCRVPNMVLKSLMLGDDSYRDNVPLVFFQNSCSLLSESDMYCGLNQ